MTDMRKVFFIWVFPLSVALLAAAVYAIERSAADPALLLDRPNAGGAFKLTADVAFYSVLAYATALIAGARLATPSTRYTPLTIAGGLAIFCGFHILLGTAAVLMAGWVMGIALAASVIGLIATPFLPPALSGAIFGLLLYVAIAFARADIGRWDKSDFSYVVTGTVFGAVVYFWGSFALPKLPDAWRDTDPAVMMSAAAIYDAHVPALIACATLIGTGVHLMVVGYREPAVLKLNPSVVCVVLAALATIIPFRMIADRLPETILPQSPAVLAELGQAMRGGLARRGEPKTFGDRVLSLRPPERANGTLGTINKHDGANVGWPPSTPIGSGVVRYVRLRDLRTTKATYRYVCTPPNSEDRQTCEPATTQTPDLAVNLTTYSSYHDVWSARRLERAGQHPGALFSTVPGNSAVKDCLILIDGFPLQGTRVEASLDCAAVGDWTSLVNPIRTHVLDRLRPANRTQN